MKKPPVWVLREAVRSVHEQVLGSFGGSPGIRDEALLDSALARPQNRFHYERATLFDLAAAYAFGLIRNHPFVDGNKRVGFAIAAVFVELNGYDFVAGEADATVRTFALAAGDIDEAAYAAWLKANARRRTKRRRRS